MMGLYIQYGCGFSAPGEWRNFDSSPTLRYERLPVVGRVYTKNSARFPANVEYGDIVKGLPIPSGSCLGIYASHILEHLSLADFRIALKHTYDLLQPGGVFRLVVPDLGILARRYVSSPEAIAAEVFMRETRLGIETQPRGFWRLVQDMLRKSKHLWMWDYKSLESELTSLGFVKVRRCQFGDASDAMFKLVENEQRFLDAVALDAQRL